MRILVTGSRDLTDRSLVVDALCECVVDEMLANRRVDLPASTVVVGDCPTGADLFAREFWQEVIAAPGHLETPDNLDVHVADWDCCGKAAGPRRNQAMVDTKPDVCLAFFKA